MSDDKNPDRKTLRVLQVEDSEIDAELVARELEQQGIAIETSRVWTEAEFRNALRTFNPDIILSDNTMPTFDGLRALALARDLAPGTPFIFVSGSIRPDDATNALKHGAADYMLKDDIRGLGDAVENALRLRRKMH